MGRPGAVWARRADLQIDMVDGGDPDRMRSLESTFVSMGCLLEVYSPMMVAVDAADEETADRLVAVLEQLASQDGMDYEPVHAATP